MKCLVQDEDLEEYIAWHVQKKSNIRDQLTQPLHQMTENGYDLQTIQSSRNIEYWTVWREMNTPLAIAVQLARNMNNNNRVMKMHRKNMADECR